MRYMVLSADYLRPTLRDESSDNTTDPLGELSTQLSAKVAAWNSAYQVVVPMDAHERAAASDLIAELDREGLDLADRISGELHPAKVRYYSEGQLRYIE